MNIQIYVPTIDAEEEKVDKFCGQVKPQINRTSKQQTGVLNLEI